MTMRISIITDKNANTNTHTNTDIDLKIYAKDHACGDKYE